MDFKIGDEIQVIDKREQQKKSRKKATIIIVVVALIFGLTVFFITNALFGKKEEPEEVLTATPLKLTEENVKILYQYVTYGTRNKRNEKFIKEQNVTEASFSNQEKFYYALQFATPADFISTNRVDNQSQKIYTISSEIIKKYMKRFFGSNVMFSSNSFITYTFPFKISGQNVATMTYVSSRDAYDTVFNGLEEDIPFTGFVKPYYTKLTNAYKEPDGSYRLEEKIIYTEIKQENDSYNINIYKDYEHTILIEKKMNQTEEILKENPIEIEDYLEKASTITYLFKPDTDNVLYFYSSNISNEKSTS